MPKELIELLIYLPTHAAVCWLAWPLEPRRFCAVVLLYALAFNGLFVLK